MKIYYCIAANHQLAIPETFIIFNSDFVMDASKVFCINIVPTQVMSPKGKVPMMGMNFSVMKNVKFKFDLINEIEEGTELYNAVLKEMDRLEQKNN